MATPFTKVLIVEDNDGDAMLVRKMLEGAEGQHFEVTRAENLSEATKLIGVKTFDAILLDLSLPDSHGIKTIETLYALVPKIPIIVMTGLSDETVGLNAVQKGAQDYLVKGKADASRLINSIRFSIERHRSLLEKETTVTKQKAKVITLTSYKGGTGVSSIAVNLAYTLAHVVKKKVLLIDGAGFANHISILLNLTPKCNLADICKQGEQIDHQFLSSAPTKLGDNLSVICGLLKTSDFYDINPALVKNFFEMVSYEYDYILIDTKAGLLDELNMLAIQQADLLFVVSTTELLSMRDTKFFIGTLQEFGLAEDKIKLIINREDLDVGILDTKMAQKKIDAQTYFALPNDWQLSVKASNYGKSVVEVDPKSKLSIAYKNFASKIADSNLVSFKQESGKTEVKQEKKKGMFPWG